MKFLLIVAAIVIVAVVAIKRTKKSGSGYCDSDPSCKTYTVTMNKDGVIEKKAGRPDNSVKIVEWYSVPGSNIPIRLSKGDVRNHIKNLGYFAKISGEQDSVAYIMSLNSQIFNMDDDSFMDCLYHADELNFFTVFHKETTLRLMLQYISAAGVRKGLSDEATAELYKIGEFWKYSQAEVDEFIDSLK